MKVTIAHLSDIHIKSEHDPVFERITALAAAITAAEFTADCAILVFSGDIAYSGKTTEYQAATKFINVLSETICARSNIKKIVPVLIPGNHDCDFNKDNEVRRLTISAITQKAETPIDDTVINTCTKVQEPFFRFKQSISGDDDSPIRRLFYKYHINLGTGESIAFHCYNTAWMSLIKEQPSSLYFPIKHDFSGKDSSYKPNYIISVFHHPYTWLKRNNLRDFREILETESDLMLTGHEHIPDSYKITRPRSFETDYIEGGILQNHENQNESSFNIIVVDLAEHREANSSLYWTGENYTIRSKSGWQSWEKSRRQRREQFVPTPEWEDFLSDPGANFWHPRVKSLAFSDIYIEPDLMRIDPSGEKLEERIPISCRDLFSQFEDKEGVLVLGEDNSGRTAIFKYLFGFVRNQGHIPLYIDCRDFHTSDLRNMEHFVQNRVKRQYGVEAVERFFQLAKEDRIIFLDDFHRTRLNSAGRRRLLEWIVSFSGKMIIFGDIVLQFESIGLEEKEPSPVASYPHFKIEPFGYRLRDQLVEKWILLGQEDTISPRDLFRLTSQTCRIVEKMLGHNIVPSYPMFIITILQAIETGKRLDLSQGALAHIFHKE